MTETAPTGKAVLLGPASDIPEGQGRRFEIDGKKIAVFRLDGRLYCIDDTCTHEDESLSEGEIIPEECAVECPKHGSLFSLETGDALTLPATIPVATYSVEEKDGEIYVRFEDE